VVFFLCCLSCSEREKARSEAPWEPPPVVREAIVEGTLPSVEESTSWIAFYDPARAFNGYTVAFYRRRTPIILDMNGRIVHAWPDVRAKSRLKLLPNGHLMTLDLGRSASEWSWEGERVWHWKGEGRAPHHDLIRLANGNTMVISLEKGEPADELLEIDSAGEIIWSWKATDHLVEYFDRAGSKKRDITHLNSVQELPENRHFDSGDERFRPGHLLISARNLSTIFVIDRESGAVTWEYGADQGAELDLQHEALMIEAGQPGAGNITLFDNGYRNRRRYRSTEILEVDPATREVPWRYSDPTFYSPTSGREQPLSNGNLLISSSRGGRVFEVNRAGHAVWQWTPPYEPRRPQRVPYDFSPQLASLERPIEQPVRPAAGYRYVDRDVYRFARRGEIRPIEIAGAKRNTLKEPSLCRELILPPHAVATLAYGVRAEPLRAAAVSSAPTSFSIHSSPAGSEEAKTELFSDTLGEVVPAEDLWYEQTLDLGGATDAPVEICVEITSEFESPAVTAYAHWANLHIASRGLTIETEEDDVIDELTDDEIEARLEHLRTLGYVD